jgi:hypothetical protein
MPHEDLDEDTRTLHLPGDFKHGSFFGQYRNLVLTGYTHDSARARLRQFRVHGAAQAEAIAKTDTSLVHRPTESRRHDSSLVKVCFVGGQREVDNTYMHVQCSCHCQNKVHRRANYPL